MLDDAQKTYYKQLELAQLVEKFFGEDGDHATLIPSLHLVRDSPPLQRWSSGSKGITTSRCASKN
jgi:hypothetical protein